MFKNWEKVHVINVKLCASAMWFGRFHLHFLMIVSKLKLLTHIDIEIAERDVSNDKFTLNFSP